MLKHRTTAPFKTLKSAIDAVTQLGSMKRTKRQEIEINFSRQKQPTQNMRRFNIKNNNQVQHELPTVQVDYSNV